MNCEKRVSDVVDTSHKYACCFHQATLSLLFFDVVTVIRRFLHSTTGFPSSPLFTQKENSTITTDCGRVSKMGCGWGRNLFTSFSLICPECNLWSFLKMYIGFYNEPSLNLGKRILHILRNFQEHLFYKTPPSKCFWKSVWLFFLVLISWKKL